MTARTPDITLVLGNKAYSSWSLRPWLALKRTGVPFAEVVIPLRRPETKGAILEHSPAGKVPVLRHGDRTVWDSLAIIEYLAETFPSARLWPEDANARAVARAVSAEMHSGFQALRKALPMDLKARHPGRTFDAEVEADIARIRSLWEDCRRRFGADGPFLFGRFSAADAMYAPVVTRFDTYAVTLDPVSRAYADAILTLPEMREWTAAAMAEPWAIDFGPAP
ncbi:glutathione S-transferase family protein [Azospirillum halopraeferens]|uniref:glutathione S-transferase family protein n=1 Tax=Azospirillum halopraeferens TaxID=34010 RepID=UPI00042A6294|nr:glutathione S-transferase family protein [Azospirillum halopraeferens]